MSSVAPDLPAVTRMLLHTLIDRAEQPGRQRVVRVRLSPTSHPDYFSSDDVAPRRATHDALQPLVLAGVVSLHWRKWEEGNWLESVDLAPERAADLYALLGRQPRADQAAALRTLLGNQCAQPGWHADFLAWSRTQLDAGRAPAPLVPGDAAFNADLLCALAALAGLTAPVLERTLSTRLFGDSKRLELLRGAVVSVLRRHAPGADAFDDDDWALLRAQGIERVPEYIPLAGPLVLQLPGEGERRAAPLDLATFRPSVALSATMLRTAQVVACSAQMIVTVENATSFNELLAVRPPNLHVLYSGGFASPAVIGLLRAIRTRHPKLPLFHWGDIDVGGLRILAHLRGQLGALGCVAMDAATLTSYRAKARPLSPSERKALVALNGHPALADCALLVNTMLRFDIKLEQEAVEASTVLTQLHSLQACDSIVRTTLGEAECA